MFHVLLIALALATPIQASQRTPPILLHQMMEKSLSNHHTWLHLLHMADKKGKFRSNQLGTFFFNSPEGGTNPTAELAATINSLLLPASHFEDLNLHPQCLFPARFSWLKTQTSIEQYAPKIDCGELKGWLNKVSAKTISLAFAGYYAGNPASLFGHSFLILKSDAQSSNPAYPSITFGADMNAGTGVAEMTIKGLLGAYEGKFQADPYYNQLKKYIHTENRDIWEYDLRLSEKERQLLLLHLWEIGLIPTFEYGFFVKNCSYYLLYLIELVRPDLQLVESFSSAIAPAETVRVLQESDLITTVHFRPSNQRSIQQLLTARTAAERKVISDLVDGRVDTNDGTFNLNENLDLVDISLFISKTDQKNKSLSPELRQLLLERSRIKQPSAIKNAPVIVQAPARGHRLGRVSLAVGIQNQQEVFSVKLRPLYHSVDDPQEGYALGSEQMMNIDLRLQPGQQKGWIEQLTLLSIQNIDAPDIRSVFRRGSHSYLGWNRDPIRQITPFELSHQQVLLHYFMPQTYVQGGLGMRLGISHQVQEWVLTEPIFSAKITHYGEHFSFLAGSELSGNMLKMSSHRLTQKHSHIRSTAKLIVPIDSLAIALLGEHLVQLDLQSQNSTVLAGLYYWF